MKPLSIPKANDGAVVIETAIVVPILAIFAFGSFDASMMVARSSELQGAAAEAAAVVLAHRPRTDEERATIEDVVEASTGLSDSNVKLTVQYRCQTQPTLHSDKTPCNLDKLISEFITIEVSDTYVPKWTAFGIGKPVEYKYARRVQVG